METTAQYAFSYQPVINAAQAAVAIELEYDRRPEEDEPARAAGTIVSAFIHAGMDDLLRRRRAFVPVSAALLESDLLDLLPADRFALELGASEIRDHLERCQALKARGFRIVLDADQPGQVGLALTLADCLRFDAATLLRGEGEDRFRAARELGVQLFAHGVTSREEFDALRQRGVHLFQGYHFAERTNVAGGRTDPRKLAVLDLLGKLSADADDPVLEEAFKRDPVLSLSLLRLVNSAAFNPTAPIRSIKHAFAVLGRQSLRRWLQILLFLLDSEGGNSLLMELALRRARFMEYVLTYRVHQSHSGLQEEAFLTGLLSLADVLMGWPMDRLTAYLNLPEDITQALLHRAGGLGQLLVLAETLEQGNFEALALLEAELQLTEGAVMTAQQVALAWALQVGQEKGAAGDASAEQDDPPGRQRAE